jgi:hypothetical protein
MAVLEWLTRKHALLTLTIPEKKKTAREKTQVHKQQPAGNNMQ